VTTSLPEFSLDGRLVIVTGASDGIGKAFALAYSRAGAEVVLISRGREKLSQTQRLIADAGGIGHVISADLSSVDQVLALPKRVEQILEGRRPKLVLINNAGFGFTKPAIDVTERDWNKLLDLQLKGTFFVCQAIGRMMIERGYGKIVNLSSTWSASTDMGKSVYGAAKAGVSYLTAALSTEWAQHGVRVNAIAPTTTLSENTKQSLRENPERAKILLGRIMLGRFAEPDDLVGAAIFLAAGASDFITGQTLFVDGGWNALGSR
jgi:2-deoxy-D-gluconate 3-dehydrogenase